MLLIIIGYVYFSKEKNVTMPQGDVVTETIPGPVETIYDSQVDQYICFSSDNGELDTIMFALDKNDQALWAQYDNREDVINLEFITGDSPNPGFPTYTLTYDALLSNGVKFGTFVQTHSGVYDYLEFTNDDGEVFTFTNISEKSYVSEMCL